MSRFLPNFVTGANQEEQEQTPGAITRSRAQSLNLQVPPPVPLTGVGRGNRSRSPSPNVLPGAQGAHFFGSTMSTDMAELRRIAETAIKALADATASQPRAKRPELPAFDKSNVDIWIHRVEAAYERVGIKEPKERFAYLESKFDVAFNPKINSFLYGPATEEAWKDFLKYLRDEYGETRRQEANRILQPLQRNGLRPTQLLASLVDKTQKVTLDDIRKEKVIAALPSDIQRSIIDKVESLTAEQTAELADRYFDREGRPLQPPSPAPVNNIAGEVQSLSISSEDEGDTVNAIPNRRPDDRKFQDRQKSARGRYRPKPKSQFQDKPKVSSKPLCWRHAAYGKDARFCEEGCALFTPDQAKHKAGRRM